MGTLLLAGGRLDAGPLAIKVSSGAQSTNLFIQLETLGPEAARNVSVAVSFAGHAYQSPSLPALSPTNPAATVVRLRPPRLAGTYPAVISINFEDADAHPYSSVAVQPVRIGDSPAGPLSGGMASTRMRGRGRLLLKLRNNGAAALSVTGRVVTARELVADPERLVVNLPAHGRESRPIGIANFAALPASRYPVHALFEYEQGGVHFTTLVSARVQIGSRAPWWMSVLWFLVGALLAGVLGALLLRRKPAGMRGAAATE